VYTYTPYLLGLWKRMLQCLSPPQQRIRLWWSTVHSNQWWL